MSRPRLPIFLSIFLPILWRWLCCLTGHHRETVTFAFGMTGFVCMDCLRTRVLSYRGIFTPSRRYALKRHAA